MVQATVDNQVFIHRKFCIQVRVLRDQTELGLAFQWIAIQVIAVQAYLSLIALGKTGQDADGGRLARPIGAQIGINLSCAKLKGDAGKSLLVGKLLAQVMDFYDFDVPILT